MERERHNYRRPAVAGTFYPSDRTELLEELENLFASCNTSNRLKNIRAVISPHAGYIYSGIVAASAYNQLLPETEYENVFLIGSSHHSNFDGAALYTGGDYITPLGHARVNKSMTLKLLTEFPDVFKTNPQVQDNEHALEVQVPFLQYLYKDKLQIIPIIIGTQNPITVEKIAEALAPYFNVNNLFVISTDFSHYPDYQSACTIDADTASAIVKNSPVEFLQVLENNEQRHISNLATSVCGWTSVLTLLNITEDLAGIRYHELLYMNSGDVPYGDRNRVVGYHAMAVTLEKLLKEKMADTAEYLNPEEKEALLKIARVTLEENLSTGKTPEVTSLCMGHKLFVPAGVFVSLSNQGRSRGCIGQFHAEKPLYIAVQEMAISAATHDFRYYKVTREELDQIKIEISVLTPLRKIRSINDIKPGKHGIYMRKGTCSGTFLPRIAVQNRWSLIQLLGHCARDKAGIGWDGWQDAEIFIFEAFVYEE